MDIPYMIQIPVVNEAGSIDPEKASKISSKVVVQFFNKYLLGKNIDFVTLEKEYPDLELVKVN
jgi:hypothetical protein